MTALSTQDELRGKPEVLINNKIPRQRKNFLDITALIRSLQRSEGNIDCFKTGKTEVFSKAECGFGYRDSIFKKEKKYIILNAVLKLKKG